MKVLITVCVIAGIVICGDAAATPSRPQLSSTCSFNYTTIINGGMNGRQPIVHGVFGALYDKNETKRMQMVNQSTTINGTKTRHDWILDRMDFGIEYSMNWTRGMPRFCSQSRDAYVVGLWADIEEYEYNGTKTLKNGQTLNIWIWTIVEEEKLVIGVPENDNTQLVFFEQIIKQDDNKISRTTYNVRDYTNTPDKAMFNIPKLCQQRDTATVAKTPSATRSKLPFGLYR